MKSFIRYAAGLAALLTLATSCKPSSEAASDRLVIIHTNDTHSAIEPDRHDLGGYARRKVLIDSIREANADGSVMLVDAGDAVQGSLYYTLFKGEVERRLMNELGYDIQILGNHEFDKGMEELAAQWSQLNATRLSTNYDFTGSTLEGLFVPSVMKEFGGHKVGFLGINLAPQGIIVAENCKGVKYSDAIAAANEEAARLRAQGAEMVIAVTHIGYDLDGLPDDVELARGSKDIDVIIGGHSHTVVDPAREIPAWRIANAEGDTVSVLQTGSSGVNLGEIDIDLATKRVHARLIPVDKRLDSRVDPKFVSLITPYKQAVDSMRAIKVGNSPVEYVRESTEMLNLMSDFVYEAAPDIFGKPVDIAIMNKGGIRNSLAKGPVTQGELIDIAPFDNSIVVLDISGKDLLENFGIMAAQDGNGVSRNVRVLYDPETREVNSATIDGKPVDPSRRYRLATIDYLAAGNDYMTPLTRGTLMGKSRNVLYLELIDRVGAGKLDSLFANPDTTPRMSAF